MVPGQRITMDVWGVRGSAASNPESHSRFLPASVSLFDTFDIKTNSIQKIDAMRKIARMCPAEVFDVEDSNLVVSNPQRCNGCGKCADVDYVGDREVCQVWDMTRQKPVRYFRDVDTTPIEKYETDVLMYVKIESFFPTVKDHGSPRDLLRRAIQYLVEELDLQEDFQR